MRDVVLFGALLVTFAAAATAHVWLSAVLLLREKPRWRALVALFIPPLAPIYSYRAGRRGAAMVWLGAQLLYAVALVVAHVWPEASA